MYKSGDDKLEVRELLVKAFASAWEAGDKAVERDDRGRRALPLGVGDDDGLAALDHRHTAVGSPQVNSDYFCHGGACPFKKDTFES